MTDIVGAIDWAEYPTLEWPEHPTIARLISGLIIHDNDFQPQCAVLDLHEALYADFQIMLLVLTRDNDRERAGLFPNAPLIHNTSCDSTITS
jgi:hypothetical protein